MTKLTISDFAELDRLYKARIWCWSLGAISWLLAMLVFPIANRNPKVMATSAFHAFAEAEWLTWLILPMFLIGLVFFGYSLFVTWKIKMNKAYQANKEHEDKSNVT